MFCIDENIQYAAYPNTNEACKSGEQFGVQAVGGLAIIAWTCATAGATFVAVNATVGMRVSAEIEEAGLDLSEHGAVGDAWAPGAPPVKEDAMPPAEAGMVYLGGDQYGQA
jgi:ammonia channel protein AmtB